MSVKASDFDDVRKVLQDQNLIAYVCMCDRVGFQRFCVTMEYTYFVPDTPLNEDLQMILVKWPSDMMMIWGILIIPKSYREKAEAVMKDCQLKPARSECVAQIIGPKGVEYFPISGPNVHFLENYGDSVMYSNDKERIALARKEEEQACQVFFDAHLEWCKNNPELNPDYKKEVE